MKHVFIPRRTTFSLVVALAMIAGLAMPGLASTQRGKVVALMRGDNGICDVIKGLKEPWSDRPCNVQGNTPDLVVIRGGLPGRFEPGKMVILKTKGLRKNVAKVIAVIERIDNLEDLANNLKGKNLILWICEKTGRIAVLKAEKEYLPNVDAKVKMKLRSKRTMVEGC